MLDVQAGAVFVVPVVCATSLSLLGLCHLLRHGLNTGDERLQAIVVQGDEVFGPNEGTSYLLSAVVVWSSVPHRSLEV